MDDFFGGCASSEDTNKTSDIRQATPRELIPKQQGASTDSPADKKPEKRNNQTRKKQTKLTTSKRDSKTSNSRQSTINAERKPFSRTTVVVVIKNAMEETGLDLPSLRPRQNNAMKRKSNN